VASMDVLAQALKENPFVLAPMAGITDCAFRSFMKELGVSVVVTELVSATGLQYESQKTRDLMRFTPEQHPIGIQIFGEDIEALALAAKNAEKLGADFVDLNFGCPVPKVVKKGAGAGILKDLDRLAVTLRDVKKAIQIPLTIKIRTGWDEGTRNAHEVVKIAYNEGVHWVAIHGRTRAQGYSGLSDWDYITDVKSKAQLPILGNGDIQNAVEANERLKSSGCDGVLIGRGCLKNPWIFEESRRLYKRESVLDTNKNFKFLFERLNHHLQLHCQERVILIQLKKFASWFSSGYPGASQFRHQLFSAKNTEDIYKVVEGYFEQLKHYQQADTRGEAFLMGGHG